MARSALQPVLWCQGLVLLPELLLAARLARSPEPLRAGLLGESQEGSLVIGLKTGFGPRSGRSRYQCPYLFRERQRRTTIRHATRSAGRVSLLWVRSERGPILYHPPGPILPTPERIITCTRLGSHRIPFVVALGRI